MLGGNCFYYFLLFVIKKTLTNHGKWIGDAGDDEVSYGQVDQEHWPGILQGFVHCHSPKNTQVTQSTKNTERWTNQ